MWPGEGADGGDRMSDANKSLVREITEVICNRRELDEIRDGKVCRQRGVVDNLSALRQLGVLPAPKA